MDERIAALLVVDAYVESTPDPQYRKDPTTWLNQRCWEDEVIPSGPAAKAVSHMPNMPLGAPSCGCAACVAHRAKDHSEA